MYLTTWLINYKPTKNPDGSPTETSYIGFSLVCVIFLRFRYRHAREPAEVPQTQTNQESRIATPLKSLEEYSSP